MEFTTPKRTNSVLTIVTSDVTPGQPVNTTRRSAPVDTTAACQNLSDDICATSERDLEEARRINAEADDLKEIKEALSKVLSVADTLTTTLATLRSQQARQDETILALRENQQDLETTLTLAKSNLTLERANNEMLEEALKRSGGASAGKDVGWKRYSEREASTLLQRSVTPNLGRSATTARPNTARSASEFDSNGRRRSFSTSSQENLVGGSGVATPITSSNSTTPSPMNVKMIIPPPEPQQESSRFFKFRFGAAPGNSGNKTPSPSSSGRSPTTSSTRPTGAQPPTGTSPVHLTTASLPAQLTSSSMPSLLPAPALLMTASAPARPATPPPPPIISPEELFLIRAELSNKKIELESLHLTHDRLKKSHSTLAASYKTLQDDKKALEEEIESLSQALFEEANKMVADERKKRAAYEEELQVCRAQMDALKGALTVVESENSSLRVRKDSVEEGSATARSHTAPTASINPSEPPSRNGIDQGARDEEHGDSHTPRLSVSSSLHAVKSQPSTPPIRRSASQDSPRQSTVAESEDEQSPVPLMEQAMTMLY
ncbi:hypothetical protein FRB96_005768 [Tulasnella sp. 330]|nr:hypothetical protein FRB96_005768 [Tulasnella sp. 330]KAG8874335.1 hypothetical protein FRB97_005977 [Tulasnella sp. 331]KAG8881949.1 hypothetical protein FRB98_004045 [Tulasnella sp. 332]